MQPARDSHPSVRQKTQKSSPSVKPPHYLYLRGNIFYFRYTLSREFQERFGHTEIRMSLGTGFVNQAKKIARYMRTCLEELLMSGNEKTYKELREELAAKLEAYLDRFPEKHLPTISHIKARMNDLRQKYLDAFDTNMYQPPKGVLFDNENHPVSVASDEWLDHTPNISERYH